MNRAESVKNSRRYIKNRSGLSQTRQHTILPSYLPLKKYMAREIGNMKPVRQMNREKKSILKTPFSQRNGACTSKNGHRSTSKETFEEFVTKARKDQRFDNIYNTRIRPYTSNGG